MELAERPARLKAAVIDGAAGFVLWFLGYLPMIGWLPRLATFGLVLFQLYLLSTEGQTIGKKFMGIKIVKKDSYENGGFVTNVLVRTFANFLLCLVPAYPLIDCALIFRDDRRCVHDWLAGTVVVKR